MPNLTEKEQMLYDEVVKGMDEPGKGWLHEITPFGNDHVTAGVLSSLLNKGMVQSFEEDGCTWVYLPGQF